MLAGNKVDISSDKDIMKNITQSTSQSFHFNRPWFVRHSPVFRLLDKKEYLDNFFSKGELLLSCFTKFKEYPNEIQGDKSEGQAMLFAKTTEDKSIGLYFNAASNAYILSTTKSVEDKTKNDFKAVGAIKIKNPTAFAIEISNRIPFFTAGTEGSCMYQTQRIINRELTVELTKKYSLDKMNILDNQFSLLNEISNNDEMFIKIDKYTYQNEFRLAWFTQGDKHEHLIITCPEAIQFCDRVDF